LPIAGDIVPFSGANKDGFTLENDLPPTTNPDDVASMIRGAEADPHIIGVLVRIDSPGGTPVASEIMANTFKRTPLLVVALIREVGASGGYLAASGADTIIASPFSDVGGIGVTLSYLDNTEQNAKEGLRFVSLASAPYKDYGDPNKPLTSAERAIVERDLKLYHEQFVKIVSENRKLTIEQVNELADGSTLPGALALESGLIDALGDQETARMWFAERLEITPNEVVFCE
jgi:protease-4